MEIQKQIDLVRETLNSMMTSDTSKEVIDSLAIANHALDEIIVARDESQKELKAMRDDYIQIVKEARCTPKANVSIEADIGCKEPLSFDEILANVIANEK